jgi:hypothetical protein
MFVKNKYGVIVVSLHVIVTDVLGCDACPPISEQIEGTRSISF